MRGLALVVVIAALVACWGGYMHAVGFSRGGRLAWAKAVNELSSAVPITTKMLPRAQAWSDSTYRAHFGGFLQSVVGVER